MVSSCPCERVWSLELAGLELTGLSHHYHWLPLQGKLWKETLEKKRQENGVGWEKRGGAILNYITAFLLLSCWPTCIVKFAVLD